MIFRAGFHWLRGWFGVVSVGVVFGLFFCGMVGASLLRRALAADRPVPAWAMHWSRSVGDSLRVEALLLAVAMRGEALSHFCGVSGQTIVVTGNIVKFADNIAEFL